MKTTLVTLLAAFGLVSFAGSTYAQNSGQQTDGITASPKHREMIDQRKSPSARPVTSEMACPKCRNEVTTRVDWTARGANKPQVKVVKHLCPTCDTKVTTSGHGKAAKTTVEHTCAEETAVAACCGSAS
jgi:hypothetical protein